MGAAEVIPGISGGTIALILGVYERLINAISSFEDLITCLFIAVNRGFRSLKKRFTFLSSKE